MIDNNITKISNKIHSYFENKYPKFYQSSGFSINDIERILTLKRKNLHDKTVINNIITIIDNNIKKKMHSPIPTNGYATQSNIVPTRQTNLPVNNYTQDTQVNMTQGEFLNNFNPHLKPPKYEENEIEKINNQYNPHSNDFPMKEREQVMEMMTPKTIDKIFNIVIDSKDRNTTTHSKCNYYVIDFSPSDETTSGFIDRGFNNVQSIELIEAVLIDSSSTVGASDNGTNFPYILLEIEELTGGVYEGTNNNITKAFAILSSYNTQNGFKYYELDKKSNNKIIKTFNPRIPLSKMTIRIRKPDGDLFEFGDVNDNLSTTVNCFTFKINVKQKNLATQYIDQSTF